MIHEFRNPMPVSTPLGNGMVVYVRCGGTFCNDTFAIVLNSNGDLRHFDSTQFNFLENPTHLIMHKPSHKPSIKKSKTKNYETTHESRESKRKESSEKPRSSYKAPYKNKGY